MITRTHYSAIQARPQKRGAALPVRAIRRRERNEADGCDHESRKIQRYSRLCSMERIVGEHAVDDKIRVAQQTPRIEDQADERDFELGPCDGSELHRESAVWRANETLCRRKPRFDCR